jgi:hypothetical protein
MSERINKLRYLGHVKTADDAFTLVENDDSRSGIATYGEGEHIEGCFYYCPCGCDGGHLNRPPDRSTSKEPQWKIDVAPGGISNEFTTITLSPSVRVMSGCKSHYNITNNEVIWHSDSGK